jgi:hypothetical protein
MRDSDPQENRLEGVFRDLIGTDSDGSAVGRMCRWALVGRGEQAVLAGGILFMYNSRIVYLGAPVVTELSQKCHRGVKYQRTECGDAVA